LSLPDAVDLDQEPTLSTRIFQAFITGFSKKTGRKLASVDWCQKIIFAT
jgi:hypothetical protein